MYLKRWPGKRLSWLIMIGSLGETQRNEGKLTMVGDMISKRVFSNTWRIKVVKNRLMFSKIVSVHWRLIMKRNKSFIKLYCRCRNQEWRIAVTELVEWVNNRYSKRVHDILWKFTDATKTPCGTYRYISYHTMFKIPVPFIPAPYSINKPCQFIILFQTPYTALNPK